MNYPLISDYIEAIKAAEDNFEQLKHLRPVLDDDGQPVMTGGNFAVVFKMKDEQTGKLYAVKCFTREQEGRAEAYRLIAGELKDVDSPYLTSIRYLDKELFVDTNQSTETEFPVLLMDWVEGKTLDKYLRENLDDKYALEMLAYRFSHLALFLISQPFAHGDLKPENILVQGDGFLVLVDYDGMYVPAMKGQKARELGSPDFRHPQRTEDDFDEHIDDFTLISILLSLKAISINPQLLHEYGASDRLLFSQNDYRNLADSQLMDAIKKLMNNPEVGTLQSLFTLALYQKNLLQVYLLLYNLSGPDEPEYDDLSLEVTEEDLTNAWTDEFGATYSQDRKRLLKLDTPSGIYHYIIKEETEIICKNSLSYGYADIVIPKSVRMIATDAIKPNTFHLKKVINRSPHFVLINDVLFSANYYSIIWCSPDKKDTLYIPAAVKKIGAQAVYSNRLSAIVVDRNNPLYDSRNNCNAIIDSSSNSLILGCKNTSIPSDVCSIGNNAFMNCYDLTTIKIPIGVTSIGDYAFCRCHISSIIIPDSVTSIGHRAFSFCPISSIKVPNNVKYIGDSAFDGHKLTSIEVEKDNKFYDSREGCNAIIETESNTLIQGCKTTVIPNGVIAIGNEAFSSCTDLTKIDIPDSVTCIGKSAFHGCHSLKEIVIPQSISVIEKEAFFQSGLQQITLDCPIDAIKESVFACTNIKKIKLPSTVKTIGDGAFAYSNLETIILPDSIESIGSYAFSSSDSLEEITLPKSIKYIGENVFLGCFSLERINIPKGTKQYFRELLKESRCIDEGGWDEMEGRISPQYTTSLLLEHDT